MTQPVDWDFQYDVVVVGSGAGGMTAALIANDLGLDAIVIEKSELVGGTTAVSGGAAWIPNNPQMQALDYPDSVEEALTYLKQTVGEAYDEEKSRAYVETGPALVRYLEAHTHIAFQTGPLPDYYSDLPGGKRYRALDPLPLSARELGADIEFLRPPHPQIVVAGMTFTTGEVATILRKDRGWLRLVFARLLRQYLDLAWRAKAKSAPRLTLGNALVGRCMVSLKQRGIPIWRQTAFKDVVTDDDGVVGIIAERGHQAIRIRAKRGVILAAGGFGANRDMRKTYLTRAPKVERGVAPPDINTGDAIAAGMRLGADTDLMDEAWWIPVYRLETSQLTCGMFFDRAFPGSIIVNRRGERYMDDAANYDEAGRAMANAAAAQPGDTPSYYIFDEHYRRNYIAGPLQPMPAVLDGFLSQEVKDLVIAAPDLAALADKLNIEPAALQRTVERFNDMARRGKDSDFGRGEETYERHYSDPRVHPNSTMAPITKAPFYAIPIHAGDIGTKGGLVTDKDGRALGRNGHPIPGLYAIGNSSASMMGRAYPAGGVTIGPSMVFGARAAMQIAGKPLPE